jgi:hypothetical protein
MNPTLIRLSYNPNYIIMYTISQHNNLPILPNEYMIGILLDDFGIKFVINYIGIKAGLAISRS